MTNTINFESPQAKVENGEGGIRLSQVILPYSIRSLTDDSQYLGGQMTINADDGLKFTDNTASWNTLALAKIKEMVADTEIYVPEQNDETDEGSEETVE